MNVEEFPEEALTCSSTYLRVKDQQGQCMKCFEWTSVLHPCCHSNVLVEGEEANPDELWAEISDELEFLDECANEREEEEE